MLPPGSSEVWEQQIPAFTRAGYRFIAYDRRGFGRTVVDANGTASTGADDLLALIDYLHIDKFRWPAPPAGDLSLWISHFPIRSGFAALR